MISVFPRSLVKDPMNPDSKPTLSSHTLAGLFEVAVGVGGRAPPPDPPEWFGASDFLYGIEYYVGRGGSGFVWKASRRDGHGAVAIKLVPFHSDLLRLKERWENECAALARVEHRNLIHLVNHGLAPDGESGWMAMEWIEGRNLDATLSEQDCLPFSEVFDFVSQIGGALTALHDVGLIHRDVKPGNCLRDEVNCRWVLADLGIALDLEKSEDHRVTRTMERSATPSYSPPELDLQGHAPAPSGDQYSLAFTLWEMLTGHRPLGAFPRLRTLCKSPEGIDAVLRRALATDPADRFPDLAEFVKAFQKAAVRPPRSYLLMAFFALVVTAAAIFLFTRPAPFPKRFQSGKIHVNEVRGQSMQIDMTLQENGNFSAKVRITSLHPIFGFSGRAHLVFRDSEGRIIHQLDTVGYGVGGRLMPGLKYDRLDDWNHQVPPDVAHRVASINFFATPGAITMKQRVALNQLEFQKDLKSVKDAALGGLNAVAEMLSPIPAKAEESPPAE